MLSGMVPRARLRSMRTVATVAVALTLGIVLSACADSGSPSPSASPRPTADSEDVSAPQPALVPDGSATDNLPFFTQVLQQYAAGGGPVEGRPIVDALAAAGFDKSVMQVSFDRSKTDLVADSILVSVRVGESCLIGQLVTSDRSAVTTVQPALTAERTICLIGNTRPIDW